MADYTQAAIRAANGMARHLEQENGELRAQLDRLRAERDDAVDDSLRLHKEKMDAYDEMIVWRSLAQHMTPGGSEYMDPKRVRAHYQDFRESYHKAQCDAVLSKRELSASQRRVGELEAEVRDWRECALYDPDMSGKATFKGWNRSALDRCRRKYLSPEVSPSLGEKNSS